MNSNKVQLKETVCGGNMGGVDQKGETESEKAFIIVFEGHVHREQPGKRPSSMLRRTSSYVQYFVGKMNPQE